MGRCPACGQALRPPCPASCPLCNFDFADDRVTGVDVTPYAKAYSFEQPAWRRMLEWVWFAGGKRLKHLALIRASAASRRFARLNILLLGLGLGLFQATEVGWRWVTNSPALEPTGSTTPAGRAWLLVTSVPRPLLSGQPSEIPVELWWNPLQTLLAIVTAALAGWLLMGLAMLLVRLGVRQSHRASYRREGRMTAAIHYSTAWAVPLLLGGAVVALRPLSFVGKMARWDWCPPERVFVISAAVLATFGAVMWWFWLVRLGATAPPATRGRVSVFFALGVPVIAALAAAGWWFGLIRSYGPFFDLIQVSF